MHRQGDLAQAWQLYQRVLQEQPGHVGALHSLGIVAFQVGKLELAADLIGRVVTMEPGNAAAYNNLGNALRLLRRYQEALGNYDKSIALMPGNFDAYNNRSIVLHELGQLQAALESCEKAIALKPDFALAHSNCGAILQDLGRHETAIESYDRAIALQPGQADFHNNRGNALRKCGRYQEALACYGSALALNPNHAEAWYNRGNVLDDLKQYQAAKDSFTQAIRLKPDYPDACNNLGNVHGKLGEYQAALDSFDQAIRLDPGYVDAYANRGKVLMDLGRTEDAVASCRQAIQVRPEFAPAYNNLGMALRESGDLGEAVSCYLKAIELDPVHVETLSNLAMAYSDQGRFDEAQAVLKELFSIRPEHPRSWALCAELRKMTLDDAAWLETALRLASDPGPNQDDKVSLWFAIGKYYDDTKQYDLAFQAYRQANELDKERLHNTGRQYDHAAVVKLFDALIQTWPGGTAGGFQAGCSLSSQPLFIIGMPRSGTSLVEQILASHPDVFGAGELRFWGDRFETNRQALLSGNHDAGLRAGLAADYEKLLRHYSTDASRIVDKMPHNFTMVGLIHEVFPNAKFIHMRRNPVDTCLSIYFHPLTANHAYATGLDSLARYYREYERLMGHWRAVLPPTSLLDVSYEELVEDVELWSRRIVEFIGLEWDARCLDFHETERGVGTPSNWQVRQKIYTSSTARWKNYEKHLGPLSRLLDTQ